MKLSYTQFSQWERSPEEWFASYHLKVGKIPQTQPMSVGSAFDAFVKSSLYKDVFGCTDPKFELATLFKAQVEAHNRDFAAKAGSYLFTCYKECGAYADLLLELQKSAVAPVFELRVDSTVSFGGSEVGLTGHPDLRYQTKSGHWVIRDWKVNGYCSKTAVSPKKHYVILRPEGKTHKDVTIRMVDGLALGDKPLDKDWADQLTIYAWLVGVPVGRDFIGGIEQVACAPEAPPRFAQHQTIVGGDSTIRLWDRITRCANAIESGHYFIDLPREESDSKCEQLSALHSDENFSWMFRNNKGY